MPKRWQPDADCTSCPTCLREFEGARRQSLFDRIGKTHCRLCGDIFCTSCCFEQHLIPVEDVVFPAGDGVKSLLFDAAAPHKVCVTCAKVLRPMQEELKTMRRNSRSTSVDGTVVKPLGPHYLVTVVRGKDIRNPNKNHEPVMNSLVSLVTGRITHVTPAVSDSVHPLYHSSYYVAVEGQLGNAMKLRVFEKKLMGTELCGEALVALCDTDTGGQWVQVTSKDGIDTGEVLINMQFCGEKVTNDMQLSTPGRTTAMTPLSRSLSVSSVGAAGSSSLMIGSGTGELAKKLSFSRGKSGPIRLSNLFSQDTTSTSNPAPVEPENVQETPPPVQETIVPPAPPAPEIVRDDLPEVHDADVNVDVVEAVDTGAAANARNVNEDTNNNTLGGNRAPSGIENNSGGIPNANPNFNPNGGESPMERVRGKSPATQQQRPRRTFVGILQRNYWFIYVIIVLTAIVYKFKRLEGYKGEPIVLRPGATIPNKGSIASSTHSLHMKLDGNLVLVEGSSATDDTKVQWASGPAHANKNCPKCVTTVDKAGQLFIREGRKLIKTINIADEEYLARALVIKVPGSTNTKA